jgi:ubiquinone/menaquinone biosynthesis C-methylase UbiE
MKSPISYRKGIPFFCPKSETDFQKDVYERYDEMVVRQSAIHLADELWGGYPMQAIFDFANVHYPTYDVQHMLEIGCGVGRWIATLAQIYPEASCWGIDYSYQMLKRAREFWIQGKAIRIDLSNKGFPKILQAKGQRLSNLQLGLAEATELPFAQDSQGLIVSSFLLDRLDEPAKGLAEMHRVLAPDGKLILITPLNFNQASHWQTLYPPIKLHRVLTQMGFTILDWKEAFAIQEPLDARGNVVTWNCLGCVASKSVPNSIL